MFFNPKHEYGIHYSVRRKFLVSAGKNSLEPPLDFKTKKQAIQTPAMKAWSKMTSTTTTTGSSSSSSSSSSSHIDNTRNSPDKTHADKINKIINKNNSITDNDNNNGTSSSTGLSNFSAMILNSRKSLMQVAAIKKPKKTPPMIIEHFSSNRRQDWTEADEAGCHLYINKNTGEVSPTCPYEQRHITSISSPMTSSSSSISLLSYDHEHNNHHVENSRIQTPTLPKQFNNAQHDINGSTSISGNTNNKQQQQQQNYNQQYHHHHHQQQQQKMTVRTLNNANSNYNKQNNQNNIATPIVQLKKYSIKKHSSSPPRHLNKINIDDDDGGGEEEDDDDNDSLGTGSLVYDSKELDDLFDVLDHYK